MLTKSPHAIRKEAKFRSPVAKWDYPVITTAVGSLWWRGNEEQGAVPEQRRRLLSCFQSD